MVFEEIISTGMLPYAAGFLIIFALVYFALNRTMFKESRGASTIIAIACGVLGVWWFDQQQYQLWQSFIGVFGGFDDSIKGIVFIGVVVLILLLLYKGFSKNMKTHNFPFISVALSAILILSYFVRDIVSVYYLPEWLQDDTYRLLFLIAGILVGIYALYSFSKKRRSLADAFREALQHS